MILIADSGSTKTDWQIVDSSSAKALIQTNGYNPYYQDADSIAGDVHQSLLPNLKGAVPSKIFFYGAGCSTAEKRAIIYEALHRFFTGVDIEIYTDLLGAARALCGQTPGIACILGTGSGSCFYNGKTIEQNIPSLGFILGDEGSGADLGKRLIRDFLRGNMPAEIRTRLLDTYPIDKEIILEKVNKREMPSRYLAGFARFLTENLDSDYIFNLTLRSFEDFAESYIIRYAECRQYDVHFVGSIAFHNQLVLEELARKMSFSIGNIIQHPIDGLIKYHTCT